MRSLIPKIIVALFTFVIGIGCAYLLLYPYSASEPQHDVLAPATDVPNAQPTVPEIEPFDSCEDARQRAKSMMAADWYRAATYTIFGGSLEGKKICKPSPVYPQKALDAKVSGIITVKLLVNETGIVLSARAVKGPRLLRKAAEDAARGAVFAPNLLGGEPVNVWGLVTYEFVLP
jgi:outer membrane biosynthesis protein TonB